MAWWVGFNLFVLAMLALDLGVFHRKAHAVGFKEALFWTVLWTVLALVFNVVVYYTMGSKSAMEYLAGYVLERALSFDNIFVFLLILAYFRVPERYQHRVLFWGILGALVTRAAFIAAGVTLISRFEWLMYLFGVFLVFTGAKMAFQKDTEIHPEKNPLLRLVRRLIPVTKEYHEGKFFVRQDRRLLATPLFIVLLFVETTDVIFAFDSIPAILGITLHPFIVYSSNIFAILGLRAMYFAVVGIMKLFHHLSYGLSAVLVFIGIKMLIREYYEIPTGWALGVLAGILGISIITSLIWPPKEETVPQPASDQSNG